MNRCRLFCRTASSAGFSLQAVAKLDQKLVRIADFAHILEQIADTAIIVAEQLVPATRVHEKQLRLRAKLIAVAQLHPKVANSKGGDRGIPRTQRLALEDRLIQANRNQVAVGVRAVPLPRIGVDPDPLPFQAQFVPRGWNPIQPELEIQALGPVLYGDRKSVV